MARKTNCGGGRTGYQSAAFNKNMSDINSWQTINACVFMEWEHHGKQWREGNLKIKKIRLRDCGKRRESKDCSRLTLHAFESSQMYTGYMITYKSQCHLKYVATI